MKGDSPLFKIVSRGIGEYLQLNVSAELRQGIGARQPAEPLKGIVRGGEDSVCLPADCQNNTG